MMRPATLEDCTLVVAGGVFAKRYDIAAGGALIQHRHAYDHPSILAAGTARVTVDGVSTTHVAPACIVIGAGKHHAVVAVTDVTWFCLHGEDEALLEHDLPEAQRLADTLGMGVLG